MIRHSSSFFLSLIFHIIIFLLLFFSWKSLPSFEKKEKEKVVCVKLAKIISKVEKKIKKPIIKKPIVKKQKPKSKPKLKPVVKKVQIPKKEPLVVPIVKEESKPKETKEVQVVKKQEIIQPKKDIETKQMREARLEKEYLDENIAKIVELLRENLYYPRSARKRGIVGEILVKFTLGIDAEVSDIEVVSSKNNILSRASIKTIKNLSGEFPKPQEELFLHVPINYTLK